MKQILLYLTQFLGYKRRNFLIPVLFSMLSNFVWGASIGSTSITAALSPSSYVFEASSQAGYYSFSTETHYSNNGGANLKAAFAVVKAESTVVVTGSRIFTDNGSSQGPSAATVAGSTGLVTYSYEGAGGTSYSASPTPPTNAGTYTVTATVAADDYYNAAISPAFSFAIGSYTYIPDSNFEQELIVKGYDSTIDYLVLTSNISGVTALDLKDKNIESLIGIRAFTNLTKLECGNLDLVVGNDNGITDLDVSGMTQLKFLYCENNIISNLNIRGLTSLKELMISNNPLSTPTLDLHESPNLYYLFCEYNGLSNINITGLKNLDVFGMMGNSIETLDLSNNPDITYLDCDDNAFTLLDVSALKNLNQFYCSGNQLETLDVRGLTLLSSFYCSNNPLTCILVDDVNAAIVASTKIDPDLGAPYTFWKKDSGAAYSYCKCDLTTTWNGSSWSPVTPTDGTYAAIISGPYNVSANISACSLTVKNGATVTIPSGYNVTLNAPISVEAGSSFTLSNNANLVQTNEKSVNNGVINVNRDSSPLFRLDYTMWSSPVSGAQTLGGFSPLTSTNRFHKYDTATDLYSAVPSTDPFSLAKGYLIRMPNTWVDYVVSPPSTPLPWTGTFRGTPNNGDVTYTMSPALNGYNAVGNPYPSTLNIDDFINSNTANIDGTLWFWRKTNDAANTTSYSTCTTAGCVSPNTAAYPDGNFMSVGQGFLVKAKAGQTTLNFTNTMRVANNTNQFFKIKVIEKNRIWLNLSDGANPLNQMMVAYMSGATQDIDAAIDGRYFNDSPTALNSLISTEEFAIQGRALPFDGTDIVPLAFKTNLAGAYTIAIDHVDGLFSGNQEVYLLDSNTGIETNLKAGTYTFNAAAGVDNARFSLKYQRTLGVNNAVFNVESVTIHKNKGTLYVNSGSIALNNIKVFDIQGRLIAEQKNLKSNTATIKDLKATQQVLIVKITSQDNKVVSKKVVN